jgi:hypothetical protein
MKLAMSHATKRIRMHHEILETTEVEKNLAEKQINESDTSD